LPAIILGGGSEDDVRVGSCCWTVFTFSVLCNCICFLFQTIKKEKKKKKEKEKVID
jgi:hypothetical protein